MYLSMAFSGKLSLVYSVLIVCLIPSGDVSIGTVKLMNVLGWLIVCGCVLG